MKKLQLRSITKRLAIFGVIGLMAIGALVPAVAFAAPVQSAKCAAGDTKCVIAAGDQLISERLSSLNTLSAKITGDLNSKKITSDQANALQSDVSTNETGLNMLKTKLDGETVAKNARVDVENIYLQFRIYAVVIPRDSRNLLLDVEVNAKTLLAGLEPAIQAAIAAAPASQKIRLNNLYSDYQNQIANAETQFDTANQDLPQMTPENFNQNRSTYEGVLKSLDGATKTASKDLHQAAKDLHQMIVILGHDI